MGDFTPKSVCVLGRQPALGIAELESVYGANRIRPANGFALLDIDAGDINFKRFGGTIKVARILNILKTTDWHQLLKYLKDTIPRHLEYLPKGKFTLGLSLYGFDVPVKDINSGLLATKKLLKPAGRSVRVVPNKTSALSSAQVLHNKLTHKGAWELLLIKDGSETILAQTMFVQDIESYAARDQARPKRDPRVGMLPPKLAQIIINLAQPPAGGTVLDPFCGTGVILQEALLIGYGVVGSDIEPRMVDYSKTNLNWLASKIETTDANFEVFIADATSHKWTTSFDSLASEVYLGRPLTKLPSPSEMQKIINDVNTIIQKFLKNLHPQLSKASRICLAVPAWRQGQKFIHLPLIDHLSDMGYNRLDLVYVSSDDLIYFRESQIVARELLILERRQDV